MIADICVMAVVVAFIFIGYKAGLIRSFVRVLSYVVSLLISFSLYPIVSKCLLKTPLYDKLEGFVSEKYIMQGFLKNGNGGIGLLSRYISAGLESAAEGIAEAVTVLLINIIAFILILVLSKIIIRLIMKAFNIFSRLPIIKQFNRLGGAMLGGAVGILVLYIAAAVLVFVAPIDEQSLVGKEIEASTFATEIYGNNIILNYMGREK